MALTQAEIDRLMRERGAFTAEDGNKYGYLNSSGVGTEGYGDPGIFGNGAFIRGSFKPNDPYNILDAEGKDTGRTGIHGGALPLGKMALMYAAMLAGGAAAGGAFGGAGGSSTLGANGAFLGEGAASGIPAWDGALSAAQAGTAGTAAAAGLETLPNLSPMEMPAGMGAEPFVPSSAMSTAFSKLPAASSLLGDAGKYLGPAATALGAISGAQDQPGQTSTRDLPEWLKPYVTGMLDKTRGLLDQQMPIAQQQATGLLSKGNSLMNINPAGNGFGLFTKGRY